MGGRVGSRSGRGIVGRSEKRVAGCVDRQREGEAGEDSGGENSLHREQDDPLEGFAGVEMLAVRARASGCCVGPLVWRTTTRERDQETPSRLCTNYVHAHKAAVQCTQPQGG